MSEREQENRKGCNRKGLIWFFVFAIAVVAAFLIVGLVKTCTAEHEEKMEEEIQQEEIGMIPQAESSNMFA